MVSQAELPRRVIGDMGASQEFATAQERLDAAPILFYIPDAPPGTALQVVIKGHEGQGEKCLTFTKAVDLPFGSGGPEWALVSNPWQHDQVIRPVMLYGACIPGEGVYEKDTIRADMGFCYYDVATFRTAEDVPDGLLVRHLPPPEHFGQLAVVGMQVGQVVAGADDQLYWRMPTQVYETGPVDRVGWVLKGAPVYSR